ncbi:hypothetical protein ABPG72_001180 [Tetrahymena utriculariae]
MSDELLSLNLGQSQNTVKVHPIVPLSILEFTYRNYGQKVMGSLLGIVHSSYIEVTNCYAVPQEKTEKSEEFKLDANYHNLMYNHNTTVYPQESLVGAFVIESVNFENDLIHLTNFYSQKDVGFASQPGLSSPIILSIDPKLKSGSFNLKVLSYDKQLDMCKYASILPFKNIPVTVEFSDEKLHEIPQFIQTQSSEQVINTQFLQVGSVKALLTELLANLSTIQKKIQNIVDGKAESDDNLGKQVKKLLNFVPTISQEDFEKGLSKANQDAILISFVANLAKTQSLITEKLNQISIQ